MLDFVKEKEYINKLNVVSNKCKIFSIVRGILGMNFIAWMLYFISDVKSLTIILSIVSFIALILFILLTNKYYKEELLLKNILKAYQVHYRRRNYDFNALIDDGYEFIDKDNYMLQDLDIFGKKSLFQFINQAKTKLGRNKLAKQLKNPDKISNEFTSSIIELGNNENSILIESSINLLDNNERKIDNTIFNNLLSMKIIFNRYKIIINLLSVLSSYLLLILGLLNIVDLSFFIVFLILNFITSILIKNDAFNIEASMYHNLCDKYINIIDTINKVDFKEKYLVDLISSISNSKDDLAKFKSLFSRLSSRKNILFRIILNMILPYDYLISVSFNNTLKKMNSIDNLFEDIALLEVLLSFSNIIKDTNHYTVGTISDTIIVKELIHPLINNCIPNDYNQVGGVILTGCNMSGKTTFMRTIGINQVLFNACGLACAKEYFTPNLQVFTSLRASDELSEGISTFYAEILRMKLINEKIKNNKCLILVDEIFKGTNANDRINASLMVIDKLNKYNQLFIISTHDFELCDAKNITNYHFNESYNYDKITFDYKIKEGKCDTKNAIYLLRMANIIE